MKNINDKNWLVKDNIKHKIDPIVSCPVWNLCYNITRHNIMDKIDIKVADNIINNFNYEKHK